MKKQILDNVDVTSSSEQIAVLKRHFPACFDKDGKFMPDKLAEIAQAEGADISREGYSLNWLGKSYARLLANLNTETLLAANTEHNAKDENKASENILIQGDNLDVLKHLKNAYAEQIKVIYIDPPYNTGSDGFVYQDDRKFTVEELAGLAGIDEDEAKRILTFTTSNSSSHSAWLTFMYPRLYIGKELLKEEGVIFLSIDDNEQAQLKMLCDEVFGEGNFITSFARATKTGGAKGTHFTPNVEYVLAYAKNKEATRPFRTKITDAQIKSYYNKTETVGSRKGEKFGEERLYLASLETRPNQRYWIECPDGSFVIPPGDTLPTKLSNGEKVTPEDGDGVWRWTFATFNEASQEKRIIFKETDSSSLVDENGTQSKYNIYYKLWLKDQQKKGKTPGNLILNIENRKSSKELKELKIPFGFAKPTKLLKFLIGLVEYEASDIVLDFFAGSGSTAHAVMALNTEEKGKSKRRHISVQLAEPTEKGKEAYKAGFNNIYEITRERILRAAKKIQTVNPNAKCDFGFKEFKTIPVFDGYLNEADTPDQYTIFDGDKLSNEQRAQLLLTWQVYDGLPLTLDLVAVDLAGYTAHQGNHILYCISSGLTLDHILKMLERIDTKKSFAPQKIVVFEYILSSKAKREIMEAVNGYNNRKQIELHLEIRL